jgi:hypothetical protein
VSASSDFLTEEDTFVWIYLWFPTPFRCKVLYVKHPVIGIVFVLVMVVCAQGQNLAPQAPMSRHFYWSARKAHELDYKKTIRNTPDLDPDERALLLKTVVALIRPFMADLEISSERELRKIASDTRVELVDLNGDGTPEVITQAFGIKSGCGATGNCPIWIFIKTANGYKLLLDTRDKDGIGGVELITVEESRTNGFSDLVLAAHDSASEKSLLVYRYKDGLYRDSACYDANWQSWSGELHYLKQPVITKCSQH